MGKLDQIGSRQLRATERVIPLPDTCHMTGKIRVDWPKAIWIVGHGVLGVGGLLFLPSFGGIAAFLLLTALSICTGHSVGMHRLLIHRSFQTPRWLEYTLVWIGVLVGMAGPFGMIRAHDLRDWHQRQATCAPHPAHRAGFYRDAFWQLCCRFDLKHPPKIALEDRVANDRFYRLIEVTWMAQQIPLALILFFFGGWSWVLLGISLRIFVSLVGHWMVGHFAHRVGGQIWAISGVAVQGYNLRRLGILTFGENWHANHHAYPSSAKLGIDKGQVDPGFYFIRFLEFLGLAWGIKLPSALERRKGAYRVDQPKSRA